MRFSLDPTEALEPTDDAREAEGGEGAAQDAGATAPGGLGTGADGAAIAARGPGDAVTQSTPVGDGADANTDTDADAASEDAFTQDFASADEPGDAADPGAWDGDDEDLAEAPRDVLARAQFEFDEGDRSLAFQLARNLVDDRPELRIADRAHAYQIMAFTMMEREDYEGALEHWVALSELQPRRFGPFGQAVTCFLKLGRHRDGTDFIDRALERNPEFTSLLIPKLRLMNAGGITEGVDELVADIRDYHRRERNHDIAILLGRFFSERKRYDEAIAELEAAAEYEPGSVTADLYLGRTYYLANQYGRAREVWTRLAEGEALENRYEAEVFMGRIAILEGDDPLAETHLERAIAHDPTRTEPYRRLLNIALRRNDYDAAIAINARFFDAFPDSPTRYLQMMRVSSMQGKYDASRKLYDTLVEEFGDRDEFALDYARGLRKKYQVETARDFWEDRLRRHGGDEPPSPEVFYEYAATLDQLGDHPAALRVVTDDLKPVENAHQRGLMLQANLLRILGESYGAAQVFRQGAEMFPLNSSFWEGAINFERLSGTPEETDRLVERAVAAFGDDTHGDYSRGRILRIAHRFEEAEAALRRVIAEKPDHTDANYILDSLFARDGRLADAERPAATVRRSDWRVLTTTETLVKLARLRALGIEVREGEPYFDALFDHIVARPRPDHAPEPDPDAGVRVAVLTSSLGSGGAERQVSYTSQGVQAGDGVASLTIVGEDLSSLPGRGFFVSEVLKSGHTLVDMNEAGVETYTRNLASRDPRARNDIALLQSLPPEVARLSTAFYGWLRDNPTDVIHAWQDTTSVAAGFAGILAGVPRILLSTRSTRPDTQRRFKPSLNAAYRALMRRPEIVMVNNSVAGARDYEDWLELPDATVGTIYNGLDVRGMRRRGRPATARRIREDLGVPPDALVVGGVMRYTEEKRPELFVNTALAAVRRDPRVHFLLVGDGPMRQGLQREIDEADAADPSANIAARIHLVGAKRPVEPWMRAMDMLFLSSRLEGLPNVLIEAQCLGVPVASMEVGGAPEAVGREGSGILIRDENPDVIASILLAHLYDPQWRARASGIARSRIERMFSIEAMSGRTRELYRTGVVPSLDS